MDAGSDSLHLPIFKTWHMVLEPEFFKIYLQNRIKEDSYLLLFIFSSLFLDLPIFLLLLLCEIGLIILLLLPAVIYGFSLMIIGIIPSLMISIAVTGITIIRLPKNIYLMMKITYRTVILRRFLKMFAFILIPVIILLLPFFTFLFIFVVYLFKSFLGYPLSWTKMKKVYEEYWEVFATSVDQLAVDYGSSSGIPENWNGRVYGTGTFDPLIIFLSIILYVLTLVIHSIGITAIFILKLVPFFLLAFKNMTKDGFMFYVELGKP